MAQSVAITITCRTPIVAGAARQGVFDSATKIIPAGIQAQRIAIQQVIEGLGIFERDSSDHCFHDHHPVCFVEAVAVQVVGRIILSRRG